MRMRQLWIPAFMSILLLVVIGQGQQTNGTNSASPQIASQQNQLSWGGILYDDFNQKWLNPAKWDVTLFSSGACYYSTNALECVREVKDGKLRLEIKNYGAKDSNEGIQYGESKILFKQPFVKVTADVDIRNISSRGCPANPTDSWATVQITGRFFNSGTGNVSEDVDADIMIGRSSLDDPGMLYVSGQMFTQWQYSGWVRVGSFPIGTPIRATLLWNRFGHKFTVGFENLITHRVFSADIPYSLSDTMAPSGPWDVLYAQTFSANCTDRQTSSQIEATIDNVFVNH